MDQNSSKSQLLLLEDVKNLGRKGDLVKAKRGFVRNFLLPKKQAVIADKRTIRWQERLQAERAQQAAEDKAASLELSKRLETERFCIEDLKIDGGGHLFGSVAAQDIVALLKDKDVVELERKQVLLAKPIKKVGVYTVALTLKEGVSAAIVVQVGTTAQIEAVTEKEKLEKEAAEAENQATQEETGEELESKEELAEDAKEEIDERTK